MNQTYDKYYDWDMDKKVKSKKFIHIKSKEKRIKKEFLFTRTKYNKRIFNPLFYTPTKRMLRSIIAKPNTNKINYRIRNGLEIMTDISIPSIIIGIYKRFQLVTNNPTHINSILSLTDIFREIIKHADSNSILNLLFSCKLFLSNINLINIISDNLISNLFKLS